MASQDLFYSDSEVVAALSNAQIAVTRWNRLSDAMRQKPHRLRAFSEAVQSLVLAAITEIAHNDAGDPVNELALTTEEQVLVFTICASQAVLSPDILPEDSPLRKAFIGRLIQSGLQRVRPAKFREIPAELPQEEV